MSSVNALTEVQNGQSDLEDWVVLTEPKKTADLPYYEAGTASLRYYSAGLFRESCFPSGVDKSRLDWVPEYLSSLEVLYDGLPLHGIDFEQEECKERISAGILVSKKRFSELRLSVYSSIGFGITAERHFVSLLCDVKRGRVYILNTKGAHPSQSYLVESGLGLKRSDTSVAKVASFVAGALGQRNEREVSTLTIEYMGACVQKPRDCVPCTEMLLRHLVAHSDEEASLQRALDEVHKEYEQVDQLREFLLGANS